MTTAPAEHYLPGFFGLDFHPAGEVFVAPADLEFFNAWNAHRPALKSIGYGTEKRAGQWMVTFRPGIADRAAILDVLGRIRQRTHDQLMQRSTPKW